MTEPAPAVPSERLAGLARLAREAGAGAVAAEAEELAGRVAEGRFFVACIGLFKRGKSTLINALVGRQVLPTGAVPVTSVVTVVRHGGEAARVRLAGRWTDIDPRALADYVTEMGNPGNARGVRAVEVFVPHPLLAGGLCLLDTPGLGSTSQAAGAATREVAPRIDAVIAVIGADPPLTGEELAVLAETAAGGVPLLIVLNKADRLPAAEREQVAGWTRQELARHLGPAPGRIYQVSAAAVLRGEPPAPDWHQLNEDLTALGGRNLVRAAAERGTARLAARLAGHLHERRQALERPLAESVARLERLRAAIAATERLAADLGPLLAAGDERLRWRLGGERERFLAAVQEAAVKELRLAGERWEPAAGRRASWLAARARDIARGRLARWRLDLEPQAEKHYRATVSRHVELANELLAGAGGLAGQDGGAAPSWAVAEETGLRVAGRYVFNDLLTLAEAPGGRLLAALAPRWNARREARHARRYLHRLLATNSARIVNDLVERQLESRRLFQAELSARLAEIGAAASSALDRAAAAHARGAAAVLHEIQSLDRALADLANLVSRPEAASGVTA